MVFGEVDPTSPIGYNISPGRQQLISSLMILGAFISSTAAGPIAQFISRRWSIWLACGLCVVANVIMMTTTTIGGLYAGRFLIGLANGLFMTFSQLYLQEVSPAKYRGLTIAVFQTWTSLGTLIGTVIDNATSNIDSKQSYIIPLGIVYVIPGIMSIGMLFIPESPRWLLQMDKEESARKALKWLRPFPELVDAEFDEMKAAIDAEKNIAVNNEIIDIWRNPVDRRRTLLAVGAVSLQAASGAMYMISYGTYFFTMAKVGSPFMNSCILTAVGVVIIILNSFVIVKYGRRRVFLTAGMIMCGLCQLIVAAIYTTHPGTQSTGKAIVGVSVLYIIGYNGAVSSYAWLVGGEIPSQRLRSYTFGLAASIGFFGAWLTTFTAPYFINPDSLNWGPKYGYIWAPSCLIGAAWTYWYLPETKNRTFEEIDEMFMSNVPGRKFRSHKCVGPAVFQIDEKNPRVSIEEIVFSNPKVATETAVHIA